MTPRARGTYTSSTLIGGKAGVGPSSLHTMLEGTNGVSECKVDVKPTWIPIHGIEWIMFHGHLDYFQEPPRGGRPNTKP
jgi:hypothetical protein